MPPLPPDRKTQLDWIEQIKTNGRGLNEWETHFVKSIENQLTHKASLSLAQIERLEHIYANKTHFDLPTKKEN